MRSGCLRTGRGRCAPKERLCTKSYQHGPCAGRTSTAPLLDECAAIRTHRTELCAGLLTCVRHRPEYAMSAVCVRHPRSIEQHPPARTHTQQWCQEEPSCFSTRPRAVSGCERKQVCVQRNPFSTLSIWKTDVFTEKLLLCVVRCMAHVLLTDVNVFNSSSGA